jgi:hypothetical protein
MARRVRLWAGLLLGLLLAAALLSPDVRWQAWGRLRREAFYEGRPTTYWGYVVGAYLVERPPMTTRSATPLDSFKRLSGLGIPRYVQEDPDPFHEYDGAAVPVLAQLLRDPSPALRIYAGGKLGRLGPGAKGAVPALVELLHDASAERDGEGFRLNVRPTVAWALRAIDPQAAAEAGVP